MMRIHRTGIALCAMVGAFAHWGCGDDDRREGSTTLEPQPKPLESYDWRSASEVDGIDPDSVPGKAEPGGAVFAIDEWGDDRELDEGTLTDKGTLSMLMGTGLKGDLRYQDGVCDEPGCPNKPDHCSYFGLQCDDAWHYQARTINMTPQIFDTEFTGSCADVSNAWEPCFLPALFGSRLIKWRLDLANCPNNSAHRTALTTGFQWLREQASDSSIGYGITWQQTTGADWDLFVGCQVLPGAIMGEYSPRSPLNLSFALAVDGGENYWVEDCTSPNLPGSGTGPARNIGIQQMDMMYTVQKHEVLIDMQQGIDQTCACTTNTTRRAWCYENLLLHELGHYFGLGHDQLQNADFRVMAANSTCAQLTDRKLAFHPFYREALKSYDSSTISNDLTVWDDDISCFIPQEY